METLTGHNDGTGPAIHAQAQGGGVAYRGYGNGRLMQLYSTLYSADKFIIESDGDTYIGGQLGIGTQYPTADIHLLQSSNSFIGIKIENPSDGEYSGEYLTFTDDDGYCAISVRDADDASDPSGMGFYNNRGTASNMFWVLNGADYMKLTTSSFNVRANILPYTDAYYDLGSSSYRWQDVWASNGTIQTSDRRLKRDINNIEYGLKEVLELHPVSYRWKNSEDNGLRLGLIAQEVQELVPEAVVVGDDPEQMLGMRYEQLLPVMIKAVQEQQMTINEMQQQITQLNSLVETLMAEKTADNKAAKKLVEAGMEGGE